MEPMTGPTAPSAADLTATIKELQEEINDLEFEIIRWRQRYTAASNTHYSDREFVIFSIVVVIGIVLLAILAIFADSGASARPSGRMLAAAYQCGRLDERGEKADVSTIGAHGCDPIRAAWRAEGGDQ